jgi:hypothetical protein
MGTGKLNPLCPIPKRKKQTRSFTSVADILQYSKKVQEVSHIYAVKKNYVT